MYNNLPIKISHTCQTPPPNTKHQRPHSFPPQKKKLHPPHKNTTKTPVGYPEAKTVYNNVTMRAFNILVETSNSKDPTEEVSPSLSVYKFKKKYTNI